MRQAMLGRHILRHRMQAPTHCRQRAHDNRTQHREGYVVLARCTPNTLTGHTHHMRRTIAPLTSALQGNGQDERGAPRESLRPDRETVTQRRLGKRRDADYKPDMQELRFEHGTKDTTREGISRHATNYYAELFLLWDEEESAVVQQYIDRTSDPVEHDIDMRADLVHRATLEARKGRTCAASDRPVHQRIGAMGTSNCVGTELALLQSTPQRQHTRRQAQHMRRAHNATTRPRQRRKSRRPQTDRRKQADETTAVATRATATAAAAKREKVERTQHETHQHLHSTC